MLHPALPLLLLAVAGRARCQLTAQQVQAFSARGVVVTERADGWDFFHHGVPNHEVGDFPNGDNPNEISAQNRTWSIPKSPTMEAKPGCLHMGPIAVAINGVALFNPYTIEGYNAVEGERAEVFDACLGHPQPDGEYHYHQLPKCLYKGTADELLGVAFDGFPVYGPLTAASGRELTTADLDGCHGQMRDGKYEYRITRDFPYIMSCYKGKSTYQGGMGGSGEGRPPPDGMRPPPEGMTPPPGGPRPGGPPPGGAPDWESCYAVCHNPAEGCPEDPANHAARPHSAAAAACVALVTAASLKIIFG